MKCVIGIVSLWDDGKNSLWLLPEYADSIFKAGGLPIILPLTDNTHDVLQMASMCDGFLFTGGHDVNPKMYNQVAIKECGKPCDVRDTMESIIFNYAIKTNKCILGICRGIQLINVLCGGTLYQDLSTEYSTNINHIQRAPYNISKHKVSILKDSLLFEILHKDDLAVNSYHHQAINRLGNGLEVSAISDDGLIEGIYIPNKKFVMAVQWHPEFSYKTDLDSFKIFDFFVRSCSL